MDVIKTAKINFVPIIILLSVVLYMGQGAFFAIGSTISKISLIGYAAIVILLTLLYIRKSDLNISVFKYFLLFTILNVCYYSISRLYEYDEMKFGFFRSILYTLLSFFAGYYLSVQFKLNPIKLIWFFLILLISAILNFERYAEVIIEENTIQNNAVYGIVMLFPFLFLIKNRLISLFLASIMYFFIILSFKRGGIITGSILFVIYLHSLVFNIASNSRPGIKIVKRFFSLIVVIIIATYFIGLILNEETILNRFQNIEDDRGSQREYIFTEIFLGWLNSNNPLNFLFGYGFGGSTLFAFGGTAHNDLLEVISNFGLFGMYVLLRLWFGLISIITNKNCDIISRYIVTSVLFAWIIDSQFQQVYNSLYGFSLMLILGFVLGKEKYILSN